MRIALMANFCCDCSSLAGEVYILASSKSMAQSHSGKLYKLVDPKRYKYEAHLQPFQRASFQTSYVYRFGWHTVRSRFNK